MCICMHIYIYIHTQTHTPRLHYLCCHRNHSLLVLIDIMQYIYVCIYVCIYIYTHMYVCVYIYIYTYVYISTAYCTLYHQISVSNPTLFGFFSMKRGKRNPENKTND